MNNNELYHHGILGQKWGVRRYQNEDGSLTSAGRARYGVADQKNALSSYRARMKDARAARKARDNKIQDRVLKEERAIDLELDKKYPKRFQKVSDNDWAKYTKVSDRAVADWKNSKEQYKADKAAARQELKENFKLTEGQKKALKIGAAVAGTALLAYGAYKVTELSYNKAYEKYARQYIRDAQSAINSSNTFNNFEDNVARSKNFNNALLKSTSGYYTHYGQSDSLGKKLDNHLYTRIRRGTNFNPEVNDSLGILEEEYSYDPKTGVHRQQVTKNKRMKINISQK